MKIIWQNSELWLIALAVFVIALFFVLFRMKRLFRAVSQLSVARYRSWLLSHFSRVKTVLKGVLFMIGITSLLVALMRPSRERDQEVVAQEGRDLFIALDISRSMLATDSDPNRLAVAKKKIMQLVQALSCERVGLLLFSGSAFIQCPLTTDKAAFRMLLEQVDVEAISSGTTALDKALSKTLDAFEKMIDRKNKLLVVFTDGEDFSSNLSRVKERAQQQGLHLFAVGVGTTEGGPIPLYDEHGVVKGHQRDERGKVVITHLNEGILQSLARSLGGRYVRTTTDDADVAAIVRRVQQFEKEKIEDKKYANLEELYPYVLLVSFISFALEWVL